MEENTNTTPPAQNPVPKKEGLTLPVAIVIAAFLIAIALIVVFLPRANNTQQEVSLDDYVEQVLDSKKPLVAAPVTADDHIRGAATAAVTIIEYSDLECPYCQVFHETMQQVMTNYADKVRWVYRHMPLDCADNDSPNCTPLHPSARAAALAAECVAVQKGDDGFWAFTDDVFGNGNAVAPAQLTAAAERAGVTMPTYNSCVTAQTYLEKIGAQSKDAIKIGARGTPYVLIVDTDGNSYTMEGAYPYEVVSKVLDKVIK